MTFSDGAQIPSQAIPFEEKPPIPAAPAAQPLTWIALLIGGLGLGCSVLLWQKVNGMQENLAVQAAQATAQATEARTLAKDAQDLVRDASGKLTLMEARVQEVAQQRAQLDTMLQNLSRSRDETLLVDMESAVRMAQQQTQLTGSTQPLVAVLQNSLKRLERAELARLASVQHAIARDLERLTQSAVTDTTSVLHRLDDVVRMIDDLHVQNSAPLAPLQRQPRRSSEAATSSDTDTALTAAEWQWWVQWAQRIATSVRSEAQELLSVSRIDHPDALLLSPEHAFFLKENLKLKLLNARLAVLSRQFDVARSDVGAAQAALSKYFAQSSRRTHQVQTVLAQLQIHLQPSAQPSLDETLTALATAANGL